MILDRLKEYIDYKGISIAKFEKSIGMSNASFGRSLKNKGAIGTDKLENILNVYPDINVEWLCKGVGEMIIQEPDSGVLVISPNDPVILTLVGRIENLSNENLRLKDELKGIKQQKKYRHLVKTDIAAESELREDNPDENKEYTKK